MFSRNYLIFLVTRIIGIFFKPLVLFILIALGLKDESSLLALFFLVLISLLVIFSVPAHFDFYDAFFKKQSLKKKLTLQFKSYIEDLFLHVIFFISLAFIFLLLSQSILISFLFCTSLISEKVFDEIQRLQLFSKQFLSWSIASIIRIVIPALATVYFYYFDKSFIAESFILATIISNLVIFIIFIPKHIRRFISKTIYNAVTYQNLKDYLIRFIETRFFLFMYSFFNINFVNIDKWILALLTVSFYIDEYVLFSQIGAGMIIFSNLFFVSNRRSELMEKQTLHYIFMNGFTIQINFCIFIILCATAYALYFFKIINFNIELLVIISIFSYYFLQSVMEPLVENIFWNKKARMLFIADFVIFILISSLCVYIYFIKSFYLLPFAILSGLTVRLLLLLVMKMNNLYEIK